MIKLDRSSTTAPTSLDLSRSNSAANNELNNNRGLLAVGSGELAFTAYAQNSVKVAIRKLTNNRCAYCGIRDKRSDVVIEHYRPKALVVTDTGDRIKPGYHWLAPIWENLLPSCDFCNVGGLNEIIYKEGHAHTPYRKVEKNIGKNNFFPILIEDRAGPLVEGRESQEYPLLLNPCCDNPNELFSYLSVDIDNEKYLIAVPHTELTCDNLKLKAQTSIDLLGLNHITLAKERSDVIKRCYTAVRGMKVSLDGNFCPQEFKMRAVEILEFVSSKRSGSFIGLCQRVAYDIVIRSVGILDERSLLAEGIEIDTVDKRILILEEFCGDYEHNWDIGIL